MQDLKRVQYVTAYYSALQGLKLVPFGLLFLLFAAQAGGWNGLGRQGDCTLTLPLLLVVIALYFVIGRYYDRTFGRVQYMRKGAGDLAVIAFVAVFVGAIVAEIIWKPSVSLIGLVMAMGFIGGGVSSRRWYYIVLGSLTAGVSLLPIWLSGPFAGRYVGSFSFTFNFTLGLTYLVGGLVDHYLLLRAFKAAPSADEVTAQ
jgi:hypothetical protein